MLLRLSCAAVVSLMLIAGGAHAETFVFEEGLDGFTGFRDTTIYEDLVQRSGGGIDGTFSGTIRTGFLRRALLSVDLSSIPADAVVISARLEIFVERSGGNFGDIPFGLHPVLQAWGEGEAAVPFDPGGLGANAEVGDATWNDAFFMETPWETPGGDFAETASATTNAGQEGSHAVWEGPGITADVQGWVSNPDTNFGWAIITPQEEIIQRVKKFTSSEGESNRPRLIVEIEDPVVVPPVEEGPNLTFLLLLILWLLQWWFGFREDALFFSGSRE